MNLENLDKVFNLTPVPQVEAKPLAKKIEETSDDKKESDFDLARETLRDLILKNNSVIEEIISIARSSETARPFEVAGQLLKTQSEIAKDLMDLHKQKKDIDKDSSSSIKQQNNIVFAGSTSDLMKLLNQSHKTIDVNTKE